MSEINIEAKEIKLVDPKNLTPSPKNNNRHPIEQHERLKKIIKFQGFREPIEVSNQSGLIVCGHLRHEIALQLGMELVPVVYQDFASEAQEYAHMTAENEIARWAELDMHSVYENLKLLELDDIEMLGLEDFELPDVEELTALTDEESVPEVENPITILGDVWLLGKHRVMCGDSTMIDDVEKLMAGEKAEMTFTDPPYLMNFTGAVNADGSKSHSATHGAIKNDKMSREDGDQFISDMVSNIKMFCTGAYYICFYRLGVDYVFRALDANDVRWRAQIVWFKKGGTLSNSDYKSNYEPIIYGWINDHNFHGGKAEWDFWDISKTKKNDLHPTMKPIELCDRAILNSSKPGELVLDLFGGAGATLVSCQKNNRRSNIMELDEKYCDVIINRWQNYTGKQATLESTGQTYEELCNERK